MTSLDAVRTRFARNEGLPFADILTEACIRDVLNEHGVQYRDRVFSPVTTIWGFLSQVLSEDHSCRNAVSQIIAHRAANGIKVCSPNTASYCNARSRVPTSVLSALAKRTAEELQTSVGDPWKWNGRSVFIVDGSHVSMPDTEENQAVYPQPPNQKPGLGFPLARITVALSLATGACHDLAIAPYQGKGTGEKTLFRRMYDTLNPGDVVLADALFDDYFIVCELCNRGIDIVARAQHERVGSRTAESRPDGDIIVWQRPNKPRGMTGEQYRSYPKQLLMRQVAVDARDDCLPPRRRLPRTLGTAGAQTTTEEGHQANATSAHCQAAPQPFKMVLGCKWQSRKRQRPALSVSAESTASKQPPESSSHGFAVEQTGVKARRMSSVAMRRSTRCCR